MAQLMRAYYVLHKRLELSNNYSSFIVSTPIISNFHTVELKSGSMGPPVGCVANLSLRLIFYLFWM